MLALLYSIHKNAYEQHCIIDLGRTRSKLQDLTSLACLNILPTGRLHQLIAVISLPMSSQQANSSQQAAAHVKQWAKAMT